MAQFVEPVINRRQFYFLRETLDDSICNDHPVRVFDFVLNQHDWREWQARYSVEGRPPYPPEVMCKLLIYGYSIGMRSSRTLEHACRNSKDFIWLMEGRTPDHDTIANFRSENSKEFKEIFRTTVATCIEGGLVRLTRLVVDGTRVAANNGKAQVKTAADIEKMLRQVDQRIEEVVKEAQTKDAHEDTLFGKSISPNKLPTALKNLEKQQARLKQALEKVRLKMKKEKSEEKAAKKRVPITDPDSKVMKNKQGGFAPNMTPFVGVDADSGVVLTEGVTNSHQDDDHLQAAIEEAQQNSGMAAEQVQADSNYATADNIVYCEENDIDPCLAPMHTSLEKPDRRKIPAWPEDVPTQAVHQNGSMVDGLSLPRTSQGKFDKRAFRHHSNKNCYECPTGHLMQACGTGKTPRQVKETKYRCNACQACPFKKVCTTDKLGRTIKRNQEENIHQRQRERMNDPKRKEQYKLRRQTVEPTIGIFKEVFRIRKFLLRGLRLVRAEWTLASTAFNLKKLAKVIGIDRLMELRYAPNP